MISLTSLWWWLVSFCIINIFRKIYNAIEVDFWRYSLYTKKLMSIFQYIIASAYHSWKRCMLKTELVSDLSLLGLAVWGENRFLKSICGLSLQSKHIKLVMYVSLLLYFPQIILWSNDFNASSSPLEFFATNLKQIEILIRS